MTRNLTSIFNTVKKIISNSPIKKYFLLFLAISIVFIFYWVFLNQINLYNKEKERNLNTVLDSNDVFNLKEYFIEKINSPYKNEIYTVKNNDSIDKILNYFNVDSTEIKLIVSNLKSKKLTNIYVGREIKIITKKNSGGKNSIVNILYPISNTTSVEVRKVNNNFIVKENIVRLYKKEVVVKNTIKNNLYDAAVEVGIEPNIIVEFARIYGFEIDFQRDIRKGDWFEIYYEKFLDENEIVRDTGKILFASMFVNNKEINLYNFKNKNETG